MTQHTRNALAVRLDELATDIGRLRRHVPLNSSATHIIDGIACHVEALHLMLEPTAAELAAQTAPGDDQALTEAIRVVDQRARTLQHQLGRDDG